MMDTSHSKLTSRCLFSLLCIFILSTISMVPSSVSSSELKVACPTPESIVPCLCSVSFGGSVECRGYEVTQETVTKLFMELRKVNNISSEDWLNLSRFTLVGTNLTEFDLGPLFKTKFDRYIHIWDNCHLWKIYGQESTRHVHAASIQVVELICTENLLTDKGLADTLVYFEPFGLKKLTLGWNKIHGSSSKVTLNKDQNIVKHIEFLPGLSAFKNLEELDLNHNEIKKIMGGQFQENSNIQILNLERNSIRELGKGAFYFNESTTSILKEINLSDNQLKDEKINWKSGITDLKGPTNIKLTGNKFEFISADNFETFLRSNMNNSLELWDNPFICDLRMRWLKEDQEKYNYVKRVKGMSCKNDNVKTPFNTDSIY